MSLVVAFNGGASGTRAGCYDAQGALLAETQGGATNPIDMGTASCLAVLSALSRDVLSGRTETLVTGVMVAPGAIPVRSNRKSDASTLVTASLKSTLKTTEVALVGLGSSRVIDTSGSFVSIV